MKLENNKEKVVSVRINENDFRYLRVVAFMAGMTVSKYVRTLCDASLNAVKVAEKEGKVNIENIEAIFNDKL